MRRVLCVPLIAFGVTVASALLAAGPQTPAAGQAPAGGQAPAAGRGRGAAAPATPAPPPGSDAIYKSDAELNAALKQAIERATTAGAMVDAPFSNTDQYRINVVRRTQGATPLAHAGNTELHHIIDGAATVVTGGKIVRGNGAATIEGGVTRHVTKGDIILVPADTPHWYKDVEGSVTYLEVRFVVPAKQ